RGRRGGCWTCGGRRRWGGGRRWGSKRGSGRWWRGGGGSARLRGDFDREVVAAERSAGPVRADRLGEARAHELGALAGQTGVFVAHDEALHRGRAERRGAEAVDELVEREAAACHAWHR